MFITNEMRRSERFSILRSHKFVAQPGQVRAVSPVCVFFWTWPSCQIIVANINGAPVLIQFWALPPERKEQTKKWLWLPDHFQNSLVGSHSISRMSHNILALHCLRCSLWLLHILMTMFSRFFSFADYATRSLWTD